MKLVKLHFTKKEHDTNDEFNEYVEMGKSVYVNFDLVESITESYSFNNNGLHCTYINFGFFENPNSHEWYQDDLKVYESVDEVLNLLGEGKE